MGTHAAEAPKISCRLALVKSESTAEKTSVATKRIPMHLAFALDSLGPLLVL